MFMIHGSRFYYDFGALLLTLISLSKIHNYLILIASTVLLNTRLFLLFFKIYLLSRKKTYLTDFLLYWSAILSKSADWHSLSLRDKLKSHCRQIYWKYKVTWKTARQETGPRSCALWRRAGYTAVTLHLFPSWALKVNKLHFLAT
jgi:hypothetical protein